MSPSHRLAHYRPEIDGMRAMAVLAVLLYHAGVPHMGGGYIGVDVFFVISGYLITSMLQQQHHAGTFSLVQFYERRARRILPALFLILIVVAASAWTLTSERILANTHQSTYQEVLAALGMVSNIIFWNNVGYWEPISELRPLLHTWSLGVEEQFYLFYPLIFRLLWKWEQRGRGRFLPVLLAGIAASFGLMWWVKSTDEMAAFYLLPMRAWELLAGAATAWLLPKYVREGEDVAWHVRWRQLGSLAGIVLFMLAIGISSYGNTTRLLLSVLGAALLLVFAGPSTWTGRLLGSRPFVGIGLISYSVYLIHQPLFVAVRLWHPDAPSLTTMLAVTAVVLALAWLSWRFIEQPFRRESVVGRRAFFGVMGLGAVVIGGMGVVGSMTGVPQNLYRAVLTERQRAVYDESFTPKTVERDSECWLRLSINQPMLGKYEECVRRYGRSVLVLGDSHAADLYEGLRQVSNHPFVVRVVSQRCDVSQSPCQYHDIFDFIRARKQTVQAVIDLKTGRKAMRDDKSDFAPNFVGINTYFVRLAAVAGLPQGPIVYMIGPYVEPNLVVEPLLHYAAACELRRAAVHQDVVQGFKRIDAAYLQRAPAFPNVHYISTYERYTDERDAYVYDCAAFYWRDRDHMTSAGQRRLVTWLAPYIPELAAKLDSDHRH